MECAAAETHLLCCGEKRKVVRRREAGIIIYIYTLPHAELRIKHRYDM